MAWVAFGVKAVCVLAQMTARTLSSIPSPVNGNSQSNFVARSPSPFIA
jgi:hypothetical protein